MLTSVSHIETRNEFLRRSLWRVRTTTPRRAVAAAITFLLVASIGFAVMLGLVVGLRWVGAPTWILLLPWLLPTVGAVVWTVVRPVPAVVTDEDDDSWIGYSMRLVLFGADRAQAFPVRIVAAVLFGAPIVWAFFVLTLLELLGVF